MKAEVVGRKIVDQIISCSGGQLIIPSTLRGAAGLRGLPNWLQEVVRDLAVGRAGSQIPRSAAR
jgi:all-trans-retinol dehydrogenase (NAD+)